MSITNYIADGTVVNVDNSDPTPTSDLGETHTNSNGQLIKYVVGGTAAGLPFGTRVDVNNATSVATINAATGAWVIQSVDGLPNTYYGWAATFPTGTNA